MEAHWILLSLALAECRDGRRPPWFTREKPVPPLWRFGSALASELTVLARSQACCLRSVVMSSTTALQHEAGRLGALLMTASLAGLAVVHRHVSGVPAASSTMPCAPTSAPNFDRAIPACTALPARRARLVAREWLQPLPRRPRERRIDRRPAVPRRHERNTLDLYRQAAGCTNAPVLLYLHGNEWSKGHKRQQALPLLHRLAALGWVVVARTIDSARPHVFRRNSSTARAPSHGSGARVALRRQSALGGGRRRVGRRTPRGADRTDFRQPRTATGLRTRGHPTRGLRNSAMACTISRTDTACGVTDSPS